MYVYETFQWLAIIVPTVVSGYLFYILFTGVVPLEDGMNDMWYDIKSLRTAIDDIKNKVWSVSTVKEADAQRYQQIIRILKNLDQRCTTLEQEAKK